MLGVLTGAMVAAGAVLAVLAGYVWIRRGSASGLSLAVLLAAVAWWAGFYAIELSTTDLEARIRWGDLKYVGVSLLPPAWLVFVLQYTGRTRWVTRRLLLLLAIEPVVVWILLAVPATHDLLRFYPASATGDEIPVVGTGPLFWVHLAYSNVLVLGATGLFVLSMARLARVYRVSAAVLVSAALLPWVANLLHNFGIGPFAEMDLTPFAFIVTGGVLVWG
ncbi:MAG TPA: histidine kinase N-terminal 7TM domain-containing protein, partial [Nocardioidaceae bacterium]|nr:histidine kinase N-terminal 7TM domain-containing protein [Nocardioidaceae bacterium]